ncbi:MAG: hypothetical protein Q8M99_04995 [Methylotenera sp.]|nr:hypothetical protein [Methylotenera sp.]
MLPALHKVMRVLAWSKQIHPQNHKPRPTRKHLQNTLIFSTISARTLSVYQEKNNQPLERRLVDESNQGGTDYSSRIRLK